MRCPGWQTEMHERRRARRVRFEKVLALERCYAGEAFEYPLALRGPSPRQDLTFLVNGHESLFVNPRPERTWLKEYREHEPVMDGTYRLWDPFDYWHRERKRRKPKPPEPKPPEVRDLEFEHQGRSAPEPPPRLPPGVYPKTEITFECPICGARFVWEVKAVFWSLSANHTFACPNGHELRFYRK